MADGEWPEGADMIAWLGYDDTSPYAREKADDLIAAATTHFNLYANEDLIPDDGTCTHNMSLAIIMDAVRTLSRRASGNGVVQLGDIAVKIDEVDPDVERYQAPYFTDSSPF